MTKKIGIRPFLICVISCTTLAADTTQPTPTATAPARVRAPNPTRDPHTPGYVTATELPDGVVPAPTDDGNFIIGRRTNVRRK